MCRAHGVVLITIDPDGEPRVAVRSIETGLSRAAAQLAQNAAVPHAGKQKLMPLLSQARRQRGRVHRQAQSAGKAQSILQDVVGSPGKSDRPGARAAEEGGTAAIVSPGHGSRAPALRTGAITAIEPENGDTKITVDFPGAGVRSFLASLVADKLTPL